MADDKKKKKKKKEDSSEAATETDAPPSTPATSVRKSSQGSKKAKRGGSNVFDQFSEKQVAEFKEGFAMMDHDKDGIIDKTDLRQTYDELGRLVTEDELDAMVNDAPGPINFTMLINMFGQRQQGGAADEDDVVIAAFKAFEDDTGLIDSEDMRRQLMTHGEKYTAQEVDDFFEQVDIDDDGKMECNAVCNLLTGKEPDV